ncbi:uncharacterized protein LOC131306889 [Rhododendron vialii]|uniref:uncharacterized protein LOC131306889 n=1 Tax=Rhododendron vialii TaxID=182163 RepID=UPI00265E8F15|nr:uncharacterized protein LOC131306889 [Rhododendron vialii]
MASNPPKTGDDDATKAAAAAKGAKAKAAVAAEKAAKVADAAKVAAANKTGGDQMTLEAFAQIRQEEEDDREEGESSEKESQNRRKHDKPPLEKPPHEQDALLKMQDQIEGLMKHIKAQTPATVEELVQNTNSPFTPEVMGLPLPRKFKMPQLETFNGSTDPFDHLETYKSLMHLQAVPDEVMYRAFPVTLNFKELSTSFVSYFIAGQRHGKPATHLLIVKQGRWESLREYTTRFNKEVVQIDEANDSVSITAYIAGLYSGQFLYLLSQEPPKTLAELMLKAQKHMNVEEAVYARRTRDGFDSQAGPSQVGEFPLPDKKRRESTSDRGFDPKRETSTFCNKEVSETIRREGTSKQGRDGTTPQSGPVREIKVIHREFARGGESSNARKAHLRKLRIEEHLEVNTVGCPSKFQKKEEIPIIFSEEDIKGVQIPHDDPLVITIVMANYLMRRVLIDRGSSADILYLHAYDQLKIGQERLRPMTSPLVGFTGTPVYPAGQIALPITMGGEGSQITRIIDFIVVDCPSAYNAILGRATLNKIGAIISTYHLMIKFPTPEGVA